MEFDAGPRGKQRRVIGAKAGRASREEPGAAGAVQQAGPGLVRAGRAKQPKQPNPQTPPEAPPPVPAEAAGGVCRGGGGGGASAR